MCTQFKLDVHNLEIIEGLKAFFHSLKDPEVSNNNPEQTLPDEGRR